MPENLPKIFTVSNIEENKILREKTKEFSFINKNEITVAGKKFTAKEISDLIKTMKSVMRVSKGVGLSANQIGLNYRLFVAEVPIRDGSTKFYAIFNPKIDKAYSKSEVQMDEGCLSVPETFGLITRASQIKISGLDKIGRPVKIKAWGLLAQVFQHEIDHLDGKLFIDKADEIHKIPRPTK